MRSVFFGGSIAEKEKETEKAKEKETAKENEQEQEKEKEKENSPHKTRPQEKPAALRFGITDTNL